MVELTPIEREVIDQILENCRFWGSTMCKRSTLEKYCREESGIEAPGRIIEVLIVRGILHTPKPGYIGFKEPEKWGLREKNDEEELVVRVGFPLSLWCCHDEEDPSNVRMLIKVDDPEVPTYLARCPKCGRTVIVDFDPDPSLEELESELKRKEEKKEVDSHE